MFRTKRNTLMADPTVQGALIRRLVVYWFVSWLTVIGVIVGITFLLSLFVEGLEFGVTSERLVSKLWFPVILSALVLPLLIRDCLRVSNRFTGPVMRFRRAVKEAANGGHVEPLRIRSGDFWEELCTDFNRMLERLQPSDSATAADSTASDEAKQS